MHSTFVFIRHSKRCLPRKTVAMLRLYVSSFFFFSCSQFFVSLCSQCILSKDMFGVQFCPCFCLYRLPSRENRLAGNVGCVPGGHSRRLQPHTVIHISTAPHPFHLPTHKIWSMLSCVSPFFAPADFVSRTTGRKGDRRRSSSTDMLARCSA